MARTRVPTEVRKTVISYSNRLANKEKIPIEKVIVFGSQTNGRANKWSDIDVCIISPKFKEPIKALMFLLQKRNSAEVRAGIEPVGFTSQDFEDGGSFIQEIKRTGVAIA